MLDKMSGKMSITTSSTPNKKKFDFVSIYFLRLNLINQSLTLTSTTTMTSRILLAHDLIGEPRTWRPQYRHSPMGRFMRARNNEFMVIHTRCCNYHDIVYDRWRTRRADWNESKTASLIIIYMSSFARKIQRCWFNREELSMACPCPESP